MWQANPDIWGRHSPLLFPVVGKLANDHYSFWGNTYKLGAHGFARKMEFKLIQETEDSLSYQLLPSEETRIGYPFDFALCVTYRLQDNTLEVRFEVRNNGKALMPFSIGAHPGLATNWCAGDKIEDYFLEFEQKETADAYFLDADHLLSAVPERVLSNEKELPLRTDIFDRDALIFLNLKSEKLTLCSHKSDTRVTVEFPGFPHLGIWAKPGAPYVCIEPWFGYDDPANHNGDILSKPGIIQLKPGSIFSTAYRIVVSE